MMWLPLAMFIAWVMIILAFAVEGILEGQLTHSSAVGARWMLGFLTVAILFWIIGYATGLVEEDDETEDTMIDGHIHEWCLFDDGSGAYCRQRDCPARKNRDEVSACIDATDKLDTEKALNIANGYALKQDDYNAIKDYADILDGK